MVKKNLKKQNINESIFSSDESSSDSYDKDYTIKNLINSMK